MAEWLRAEEITHVAMEATGVYWRPVFHALADADGFEIVLCNAHHVKNVPGRKTDASDAVWLAQLCEVGLLRGTAGQVAGVQQVIRIPASAAAASSASPKVVDDSNVDLSRGAAQRPLRGPDELAADEFRHSVLA